MYINNLILRIILLILIPISLFEILSVNITLYLSFFLLNLFGPVFLIDNFIFFNNTIVEFIPECSAYLAYYLLFFLIIITKGINFKKRIKMFLLGSLIILIINLIRIIILVLILDKYGYIHILTWSIIGSILVALIWIFLIKLYNISSIPFYSDFKYLIKKIKI